MHWIRMVGKTLYGTDEGTATTSVKSWPCVLILATSTLYSLSCPSQHISQSVGVIDHPQGISVSNIPNGVIALVLYLHKLVFLYLSIVEHLLLQYNFPIGKCCDQPMLGFCLVFAA